MTVMHSGGQCLTGLDHTSKCHMGKTYLSTLMVIDSFVGYWKQNIMDMYTKKSFILQ